MIYRRENIRKKRKSILLMLLNRILKLLFNRIFYVAVALIVQLVWLFLMVAKFVGYSHYVSLVLEIVSILAVLWIVSRRINPSYKLAWTMLILCIPVFGLLLYLVFGQSRVANAMERRFEEMQEDVKKYLCEDPDTRERLLGEDPSVANQSAYIRNQSGYPVYENTTAEYFQVGDDMFPVLVKELSQAEKYIFIEYFIINDGIMWKTILDILEQKAAEGVDVRLMYDGFGCLTTLPSKYYLELRKKGIKCVVFNRFRPFLNIIQNNRDHRKLCIIDGHTGFTGGINLADEYINQKERFGHWKDTAIMLKGDAVWNMTAMFLHMWQVVTNKREELPYEYYTAHRYHPEPFSGSGFVQPFCDTPLDTETVGENVYLNIINRAKKYVYICTPYLIIDNEMMTALCLAAKSGVDVRIMTPGIPDKKMVFLLTQSYYEQLLEAGVKIYEYLPGFLHAKSFVCDDEVGVVGTINLDYRSLYLHFENGVWLYRSPVIEDIRKDFEETMEFCADMNVEFCKKRSFLIRTMQSLLRLLAPML